MVYQRGSRLNASSENEGAVRVSIVKKLAADKLAYCLREHEVEAGDERRRECGDEQDEHHVPDGHARIRPDDVGHFHAHVLEVSDEGVHGGGLNKKAPRAPYIWLYYYVW